MFFFLCIKSVLYLYRYRHKSEITPIYIIKVEIIGNNSHPKWTTLTPHRWHYTTGLKMVDRWKQLLLECFYPKSLPFLTTALLRTHPSYLMCYLGNINVNLGNVNINWSWQQRTQPIIMSFVWKANNHEIIHFPSYCVAYGNIKLSDWLMESFGT